MLKQLLLAKCSLAHTYTHLKLFFFSPRETVEKSLDPNKQRSTRAPCSFLCTAHGGFLKPRSCRSHGKAAGRKLLLALSLLAAWAALDPVGSPCCRHGRMRGPNIPSVLWTPPTPASPCARAAAWHQEPQTKSPCASPAGGTAPPASHHSWVLPGQQTQR